VATERHESRRIDNQLRGRSGRQGDPGASRFYLSLDDPLMRIFAGDRVRAIMDRLKMPEGEAIEAGIVNRSIESAQRKVEARNFDIRKQLLEYDDVSPTTSARSSTSSATRSWKRQPGRADLQPAPSCHDRRGAHLRAGRHAGRAVGPGQPGTCAEGRVAARGGAQGAVDKSDSITDDDILEKVVQAADAHFKAKVELVGAEQFTPFMRMVLLQSIDSHWREHLAALDYLRQGIHLRGYAQKNPKQEYKREAFELFSQLLDVVKMEVTRILMTVRIQSQDQAAQAAQALEQQASHLSNVTYTAPQRRRQRVAGGRPRAAGRSAGAQGGPQRPLPLRQRQEVQELPRQAGLTGHAGQAAGMDGQQLVGAPLELNTPRLVLHAPRQEFAALFVHSLNLSLPGAALHRLCSAGTHAGMGRRLHRTRPAVVGTG
jgi:preprotein translocase subunit SecA